MIAPLHAGATNLRRIADTRVPLPSAAMLQPTKLRPKFLAYRNTQKSTLQAAGLNSKHVSLSEQKISE